MRVILPDMVRPTHREELEHPDSPRVTALLIRLPKAAEITGLPLSLLRKSFMCEEKRPKNVPPPPPHKRIGRAIYILARELPGWLERVGKPTSSIEQIERRRRGRPTVAERMIQRQHRPA